MFEIPGHLVTQRSTNAENTPFRTRIVFDTSGNARKEIRIFHPSGAALAKGAIREITYVGYTSGNPQTVAPASGTTTFDRIAVAAEAVSSGNWGWFVIEGKCEALVEGTTDVAIGDFLKVVAGTSTTAFIKDGTSRTANSFAIALEAQADNSEVLTDVFLFGEPGTVV